MANYPSIISPRQAIDLAAKELVNENLRILGEHEKRIGVQYTTDLAMSFLTAYIAAVLSKTLHYNPGPLYSREELNDMAFDRFSDMKINIQNAIASAFQGATSAYSGMDTEYYCQVKPVPEPINRILC